jgi:hypothetical protein
MKLHARQGAAAPQNPTESAVRLAPVPSQEGQAAHQRISHLAHVGWLSRCLQAIARLGVADAVGALGHSFSPYFRKFGAGGAALIFLGGAASSDGMANSGPYRFDPVKTAPDLPLKYNLGVVKFDHAPLSMVEAEFSEGHDVDVRGKDGRVHKRLLDLGALPYWVYA